MCVVIMQLAFYNWQEPIAANRNIEWNVQVTNVWVSVTRYKHRQFSVCVSEKELQLKLTKVMRSRGLSVTLLKKAIQVAAVTISS